MRRRRKGAGMRKWGILALCLGAWASLGVGPAPVARHYALAKVWATRLSPSELARLAVCADGRSYVITESRRLVVLDQAGNILDDEDRIAGLEHKLTADCGPGDLLYLAGAYFTVLRWEGRGKVSLVANATLPLRSVTCVAVASNGDAFVEGVPWPGAARLYVVRQDGSLIAHVGGSEAALPLWKQTFMAFRFSLAFDARGRRFVEVPWDKYEFRTYGLRGKALGVFPRNDPSFEPGELPASQRDQPYFGDEVQSVIALPGGKFLTQVWKPGPDGGAYLEIFDRSFHLLATHIWLDRRLYGVVRGSDRAGDLYFGHENMGGGLVVVKAHLVQQ